MGELCRTSNTDTSRQETNPDASPGEGKVDITNVRVRKQRREKEEGGGGRGGGGKKTGCSFDACQCGQCCRAGLEVGRKCLR